MSKENFLVWKGKEYKSIGAVIEKALKLRGKERKEFVSAFCALGPYARQNVGYFSAYYDRQTALKIMRVFETAHPLFGTSNPTPEEAFRIGQQVAREWMKEEECTTTKKAKR